MMYEDDENDPLLVALHAEHMKMLRDLYREALGKIKEMVEVGKEDY